MKREQLSDLTAEHLKTVGDFYDTAPTEANWSSRAYRKMLAHYYNLLIPSDSSVLEIGCGSGELLDQLVAKKRTGVDLSATQIAVARNRMPESTFHVCAGECLELDGTFDYIILSDTLNYVADVQMLLEQLHKVSHADTRIILNFPSALWRPIFSVGRFLRIRAPHPQSNWLASSDVLNLLDLANWSPLVIQPRLLVPVPFFGLQELINRWIGPVLGWFCVTVFCVARRRPSDAKKPLTVSVVIPARNEAGNIEAAIKRTPIMGAGTELIFVEGHSRDNTWEEIQRVARAYPELTIKIMQQTGKGKGDAVRMGFAAATGDILMILDADLTMPPEELPKFYDALATGRADFANGCRLVYPMDEKAMQFLNLCANKTFGLIFSYLLCQSVKDTLCGTKVLTRVHYNQLAANRAYFGEFDPFGDFDLLFGAAKLNLKIADVPIRYRERTYGTTNIQRWKHGWLLLRMVNFAARKLKFV